MEKENFNKKFTREELYKLLKKYNRTKKEFNEFIFGQTCHCLLIDLEREEND